jgi:molecular chaperone GrpE
MEEKDIHSVVPPSEPTPPTPTEVPAPEVAEQLEALRGSLAAKTREVLALQDRLLRAHAEMENVKKRAAREKVEYLKYATEGLLLEFLPVLDNLQRAIDSARAAVGTNSLLEGVEMTARLFLLVLEKAGVKPIEALGRPFDPAFHEAVAQTNGPVEEADRVVEVVQTGYLLEGRVLRPAKVKVCSGASIPKDGAVGEDEPA